MSQSMRTLCHVWVPRALLGVGLIAGASCSSKGEQATAQSAVTEEFSSADSVRIVERARTVHLRYHVADSVVALEVLSFRRDSLGVLVTVVRPCPPGLGCTGGDTQVRVWRGDSATLVGLGR